MHAVGGRVVGALWASTHPGPVLVVTVLSAALAISTGLEPWRFALLVGSVFCGQLSVGLSNDAIDARRDRAVGRSDKPVAAGIVSPTLALTVAVIALAVALALALPLGPGLVAAHAFFLASSWIYNAGAKSTVWSFAPYAVAFGLFPSFATLAAPSPHTAPAWAWLAGATLGVGMHLANVLPDLDDDRATGVRGFPHRLGRRASALLSTASILVGAAAVLLGSVGGDLTAVAPWAWPFFAAAVLASAATSVVALSGSPGRVVFRIAMLSALLLAAQLVASGGALLG